MRALLQRAAALARGDEPLAAHLAAAPEHFLAMARAQTVDELDPAARDLVDQVAAAGLLIRAGDRLLVVQERPVPAELLVGLGRRPAEQAAVESDRCIRVGGEQLDPAGLAGLGGLGHLALLWSDPTHTGVRSCQHDGVTDTLTTPDGRRLEFLRRYLDLYMEYATADLRSSVEKAINIDAIKADVHWLGFDWGEHLYYASDYFAQLYEWAVHLIREGKVVAGSRVDLARSGIGVAVDRKSVV